MSVAHTHPFMRAPCLVECECESACETEQLEHNRNYARQSAHTIHSILSHLRAGGSPIIRRCSSVRVSMLRCRHISLVWRSGKRCERRDCAIYGPPARRRHNCIAAEGYHIAHTHTPQRPRKTQNRSRRAPALAGTGLISSDVACVRAHALRCAITR